MIPLWNLRHEIRHADAKTCAIVIDVSFNMLVIQSLQGYTRVVTDGFKADIQQHGTYGDDINRSRTLVW
jgi:hypothetical protein